MEARKTVVSAELVWHDVCAIDEVSPGAGLSALVDGEQIAIIRCEDGFVAAISNFDPFSKAFVLARGSVVKRTGVAHVVSPIYQQSFNLETGQCLEDDQVRLPTFPIRVLGGRIQIARTQVNRGSGRALSQRKNEK